jgi:hypothetical protein
MFLKGINYDVGTFYSPGICSRPVFNDRDIRKEIEIIKNDLYCECIRISGYDIDRLMKASEIALELGMQLWLSPVYIDATPEQNANYIHECANAAEKLRAKYDNMVFVAGCEYSLFIHGFIKGEDYRQRMANISGLSGKLSNYFGRHDHVYKKMNEFLDTTAKSIRSVFNGKVTYAAGTWEKVDWSIFDIVSINHYRSSDNQSSYVKKLKSYHIHEKPVAVTEFGCGTYEGAEKAGKGAWNIIKVKDGKRRIEGNYKRSETIQADYIIDLLNIFRDENIHAAFVFTFVNPGCKYNSNPVYDFDRVSYGIVKPIYNIKPDEALNFLPKEAFYRLADYYGNK